MPVDESLQTEIDSAVDEAVEVVTEAAAVDEKAIAEAEAAEAEVVVASADEDEKAEAEAKATAEADEAAEAESKATAAEGTDEVAADNAAADKAAAEAAELVAPAKPVISDYALAQAERVGIDIDTARNFPDEGSLLRAVIGVNERLQETSEVAEEEEDLFALFPDLDPEETDPETIKLVDAMKSILAKQNETIKEMQSQHEQVATNNQQASANEVEHWFDTQVEGLGADFADALGAGRYASLDRGSSQFAKRDAIASQMAILLAGYQATGAQAPPREQVFDDAARLVLRDEFSGLKEKKLASDLSKRSKQHIARANGQSSKSSESPQDAVAALVDKKFFHGKS